MVLGYWKLDSHVIPNHRLLSSLRVLDPLPDSLPQARLRLEKMLLSQGLTEADSTKDYPWVQGAVPGARVRH